MQFNSLLLYNVWTSLRHLTVKIWLETGSQDIRLFLSSDLSIRPRFTFVNILRNTYVI